MANYVQYLQPELRVNDTNLITVSVDEAKPTREVCDLLNANSTFLCDPEREWMNDLEMVDTIDPVHGEIYILNIFILDRDRKI